MSRPTFERERLSLANATPKVERQFQRALGVLAVEPVTAADRVA